MKTPKRILERRRSVRISESFVFRVGHEDFDTEALMVNLSNSGALCIIDRDIPMMTHLKVALSLPWTTVSGSKERSVSLHGVVVRKEADAAAGKFLIAIFFSDVKPADKKTLEQFIHSRLND